MRKGTTMTTITVEEAQARLSQLIDGLAPGEELVITRNANRSPNWSACPPRNPDPCPVGGGEARIVSEDDEHLKDFEDYMQ